MSVCARDGCGGLRGSEGKKGRGMEGEREGEREGGRKEGGRRERVKGPLGGGRREGKRALR